MNQQLKKRQWGAGTLEFWIACLALLPLVLGGFQGALLYNAKTVLNQATFEAARIGSVRHGDTAPMQEELARRLAGFYGPTGTAAEYTAAYAQAMTDVVTPVTAGERVGSGTRIRVLNPTREAFNDFGEDVDGQREIPNAHLKRRSTAVGPTSQVSLQDANLLKIEVTYGYRLSVPIVAPLIAAAMQVADPANALYYQADPIRLPIKSTALVRMQSPARLSAANVSVADDVDPGEAVGLGEGQGYHPLPTTGDATNPEDQGPFAGYDPQDNGPAAGESDEGEGDEEPEPTTNPDGSYKCQGTTWDEAKDILENGTWSDKVKLVSDILLAAVQGFGDQVVDAANLITDVAEGAYDIATDIATNPFEYFKTQLSEAVDAANKAYDFMSDIDQVLQSLEDLWTNRQTYIDELKNGIGQDLYNQYVAPIVCGPVDTMRLVTQNIGPGTPARVVTVFNKFRKVMKLPELPNNPDRPDGPDGPDRPDNPNNPDRPNNPDDPDGNGGNGPECVSFPAGTPILTPDGLMAIESLKVGDIVVSRSDALFITEPQRITHTFHRVAEGYQTLLIETLNPIRVTPEHPFWVQGKGWVEAGDIQEADTISTATADLLVLRSKYTAEPVTVYNFSVENTPSYFAGDDELWVHNAGRCKPSLVGDSGRLRTRMKNAGLPLIPKGYEAHHLIPSKFAEDDRYRDMFEAALNDAEYDINRASNGIALPGTDKVANPDNLPIHKGNHSAAYYNAIAKELDDIAERFADGSIDGNGVSLALLDAEQRVREKLLDGSLPLY